MVLYKEGVYKDAGTLAQLKSLINRTNIPKMPKVNVNAAEDFLNVSMSFILYMLHEQWYNSNNYVNIHSGCHGRTYYCSHSQAFQNGEL